MSDDKRPAPKSGCAVKFMTLILLLGAAGLGSALFFISQPQDLSDVEGYGGKAEAAPRRDMKAVLKNSLERGYPLSLTEAELNGWLARTLEAKQGGLLGENASVENVCVRLTEGQAELIIERKIFGKPFTTSMFLRIEQVEGEKGPQTVVHRDGGGYHESVPFPPRGGRFGKLVVPQGFLMLVMPGFEKLAALYAEEISMAFEDMARIRIEDGRLSLDPRAPGDNESLLPGSF